MAKFPFSVRALRVVQPIGVFYVAVLPADLLLEVAYSDRLTARWDEAKKNYALVGTQRPLQEKRFQQIAGYINRVDAAFPNSIILAANFREQDAMVEFGEDRWQVAESQDGEVVLTIPSANKLAAIIDGQHRLMGFTQVHDPNRRSMDLVCSIFLGLPKPYQAQLFATINSTQKPVDKSQTYELFGYNLDEEPLDQWGPDKLAVFMARKLSTEPDSVLRGRVQIAADVDEILSNLGQDANWKVSTATLVDGIIRLISTDPKKDSALMLEGGRHDRSVLISRKDGSPLRDLFVAREDQVIYVLLKNYLQACHNIFWKNHLPGSFIIKTVGFQALLDILRRIAPKAILEKDISTKWCEGILQPAAGIDFSDAEFKNASGAGRTAIRKAIERVCLA